MKSKAGPEIKQQSPLVELYKLRRAMADAANAVLDEWEQDIDGYSEQYGYGGCCDQIACELAGIVSMAGFDTEEGGQDGDEHAYVIATKDGRSYAVDINPYLYESGAGYSWRKRAGIVVTPEDILIGETYA